MRGLTPHNHGCIRWQKNVDDLNPGSVHFLQGPRTYSMAYGGHMESGIPKRVSSRCCVICCLVLVSGYKKPLHRLPFPVLLGRWQPPNRRPLRQRSDLLETTALFPLPQPFRSARATPMPMPIATKVVAATPTELLLKSPGSLKELRCEWCHCRSRRPKLPATAE